jgi:chromosome segregation ATPase
LGALQKEGKKMETEKMELQKKLYEKDTNSKQKWEVIEADFAKINKKSAEEAAAKEKELKELLSQKEAALGQANGRVDELQGILAKERADSEHKQLSLQSKCRELEETSKQLQKVASAVPGLEKESNQRGAALASGKQELEKMARELNAREKELGELQGRLTEQEAQLNFLKAEKVVKENEICRLENCMGEMGK